LDAEHRDGLFPSRHLRWSGSATWANRWRWSSPKPRRSYPLAPTARRFASYRGMTWQRCLALWRVDLGSVTPMPAQQPYRPWRAGRRKLIPACAGVDGTHAQRVRHLGLPHSRSVGLGKDTTATPCRRRGPLTQMAQLACRLLGKRATGRDCWDAGDGAPQRMFRPTAPLDFVVAAQRQGGSAQLFAAWCRPVPPDSYLVWCEQRTVAGAIRPVLQASDWVSSCSPALLCGRFELPNQCCQCVCSAVATFSAANGTAFFMTGAQFASAFLISQYLQIGRRYTPMETGLGIQAIHRHAVFVAPTCS
jgi:hypothetical protein